MKTEPEGWHDQTHSHEPFVNGDNKLSISGIHRYVGDNPNAKPRWELEYCGECEREDGELVRRRKRYEIGGEIANSIVKAIQKLAPFEKDRPPKNPKEHFHEAVGGFIVSLKQTPEKQFFVIQNPTHGWRFETEERDRLFRAFSDAAR